MAKLADLVERFGGYEFDLPAAEPQFGAVHVSLEPWRDRDPETTYLTVRIHQHYTQEEAATHGLRADRD
ncbi:hypothetical protein [Embleya scabrispora]|uniref:hypothetical protein n=1 Tax=Embleya scabrispora TaxID=159449 RepID=UPI00117D9BE3|nr:hypothetical protein [Embleya scabrispora]